MSERQGGCETEDIRHALAHVNWDFSDSESSDSERANGIHSMHSYPAKFVPEITPALINRLGVISETKYEAMTCTRRTEKRRR